MKCRSPIRLRVEQLEGRVVPAAVAGPPTPPAPYALWGSGNWSGIDLDTTKGAVTAVSASWAVPAVTGSGTGYSSAWVGIDGDISNTVEQIGTESDTAATAAHDGTPQYYAWYEMYPAGWYYTTPQTVSPGDQITATVVYVGQTKTGNRINDNFTLSLTDSTAGWTFSTTQAVPNHQVALRNSAEYIVEAPVRRRCLAPRKFRLHNLHQPDQPSRADESGLHARSDHRRRERDDCQLRGQSLRHQLRHRQDAARNQHLRHGHAEQVGAMDCRQRRNIVAQFGGQQLHSSVRRDQPGGAQQQHDEYKGTERPSGHRRGHDRRRKQADDNRRHGSSITLGSARLIISLPRIRFKVRRRGNPRATSALRTAPCSRLPRATLPTAEHSQRRTTRPTTFLKPTRIAPPGQC